MQQPKFFRRTKPEGESAGAKGPSYLGRKILVGLFVALLLISIIYFGWKSLVFGKQVSDSWQEIWFAFEKPALVRIIRLRYEKKEAALEQELQTGQSSEQQMVDQFRQAVRDDIQQAQPTKPTTYTYGR